jgi:Bacterial regulatory helix-turn-helix protein, lysR family
MTAVRQRHDRPRPAGSRMSDMDDLPGTQAGRVLPLPPAPDGIELRHLRAFVAVAEELNFGRAAARLYLSQPALSRQIRGLERLVGCDLLRRSTHQVELTLAGDALLGPARELLHGVDDASPRRGPWAASSPAAWRGSGNRSTTSQAPALTCRSCATATSRCTPSSRRRPRSSCAPSTLAACRPCCSRPRRDGTRRCCSCTAAATSWDRRSGTGTWPEP